MERASQRMFVRELAANVVAGVLKDIEDGKTPEEWDGVELRQLLADRFADAAFIKMPKDRRGRYKNTVIVNNL